MTGVELAAPARLLITNNDDNVLVALLGYIGALLDQVFGTPILGHVNVVFLSDGQVSSSLSCLTALHDANKISLILYVEIKGMTICKINL